MSIRVLDNKVISQIAAGEVVERPASVVKELVENALDAGASQISIEVRGGGISLIRVIDDGIGIPSGEVEIAFQRHATSKIKDFNDLQSIGSLGFRGEALPSIAAVARVEVSTSAGGESTGTFLALEDGDISERRSEGRARGTSITVRNLFRRVPARLKFLKSVATENSHIANVVSQYALAFPEVKFSLLSDGKKVLQTSGIGQLIDSVIEVYGVEVARDMLEVEGREGEWVDGNVTSIEVTGLVGAPKLSRAGRGYLSFFVNRRWIGSRFLAWAVEEAYHGLLMTGRHPIAVINIDIQPQEVDVNIHPTKSEVKFHNEHAVFGAVQKAVRHALVSRMPVPAIEEPMAAYAPSAAPARELWKSETDNRQIFSLPTESAPTLISSLPVLRVLGQVMNSYIVAEGPDGLYLIDQHAAHERVLFEQVRQQRLKRENEVQGLLEPATFEVSPRQDEVLKACYQDLAEFGFALEPFGDRTYLVRSVPGLLYQKDWVGALRELLESSPGDGGGGGFEEKMMESIACHSAVRAGQPLTDDEMRSLVRQMEQLENPQTCPHGRPTVIRLGSERLSREFGRT